MMNGHGTHCGNMGLPNTAQLSVKWMQGIAFTVVAATVLMGCRAVATVRGNLLPELSRTLGTVNLPSDGPAWIGVRGGYRPDGQEHWVRYRDCSVSTSSTV